MFSAPLLVAAFIAGVLSFLSPCVLPLVPGYVSMISGTTVEELSRDRDRLFRKVMGHSLMFISGFSLVFILMGAGATALGQVIGQYRSTISFIAGAVIIIFGLHLTGLLKIKALYMDKRLHSVQGSSSAWGAFVVGFAFAFGWTPCIGPILATILTLAAAEETAYRGMALLAVYSAGLAVPFLLTSLGVDRFLSFYSRFRSQLHKVEIASGVLLVFIGVLLMTNRFTVLNNYLGFLNDFIVRTEGQIKH
jgi:cytochrome c-type biogenesis protein